MAEENITTRFKVDVSDLKAGISEANKQMKLANAEFKKASSGMDDWSKSSTGITAKLKQLDSILAAQKSKVHDYNEQLNRQKQAYQENGNRADQLRAKLQELADNGVSKTSEEYKKYQKELTECEKEQLKNEKAIEDLNITILNQEAAVNKTEKEMGDLTQELVRVENAEDEAAKTGKSVEEVLKGMDDSAQEAEGGFTVLKGTLANLAAAGIQKAIDGLKNLGSAMYDAWQEYDEGADIIITKTGATGEAAEDLAKVYKNVSKSVVGDFSTLGTAVGEVNTRFGLTGKDLEDLSTKFLKFAEINGTDVNNSIDKTQAAMAAWGIEAKDAGLMLDTLNKAGQDTGVNVDKLSDEMVKLAPAMKSMGLSASDAAMFIANLEKSGVDATSVMGGMKKALVNASKEGKPMSEAMAEMEASIKNAGTETEAITIATELFGSKAGASIATAVRDGKLSFADLGTSMKDFEGNVNSTFENTLDAPDRFALAIQGIRTEMADTTGRLMEKYAPQIMTAIEEVGKVVEKVFGVVEKAIDFVLKNGDTIIAVITGIATATAVYLGYTTAMTVMTKGWQALTIVTKAQTAAQWLLNAAMNANPIGIVIALIAGLVAAFIVLWKKSDKFREFWINLWNKIKDAVSKAKEKISVWIESIKTKIQEFKDKAQRVGSAIVETWNKIKDKTRELKEKVVGFFENIKTGISEKIATARDKVSTAVDKIKSFLSFSGLKKKVSDLFDDIKEKITSPISKAKNLVDKAVSKIKDLFPIKLGKIFSGIKLPHFKISGGKAPWGIGGKGTKPSIGIDWYARGGVVPKGQMAFLEGSGTEAVVPLERNKQWIHKVAQDMKYELGGNGRGGAVNENINNSKTQNFTQVINAPKQPSRIELYRQTKNLLSLAKEGL